MLFQVAEIHGSQVSLSHRVGLFHTNQNRAQRPQVCLIALADSLFHAMYGQFPNGFEGGVERLDRLASRKLDTGQAGQPLQQVAGMVTQPGANFVAAGDLRRSLGFRCCKALIQFSDDRSDDFGRMVLGESGECCCGASGQPQFVIQSTQLGGEIVSRPGLRQSLEFPGTFAAESVERRLDSSGVFETRLILVHDPECWIDAGIDRKLAQNAMAETVDGRDLRAFDPSSQVAVPAIHEVLDQAALDFLSRFLGERDGEDGLGPGSGPGEPGEALDQHTRLARSGTGDAANILARAFNRGLLRGGQLHGQSPIDSHCLEFGGLP